jgi:hypothetical protein
MVMSEPPWVYLRNDPKWQHLQKEIDAFFLAHGRKPRSVPELERWAASPEGKAALSEYSDEPDKKNP